MAFLLDTNVISELVRHPKGRVAEHIRKTGEGISARASSSRPNCGSARLGSDIRSLTPCSGRSRFPPFETLADVVYGELRADLERIGRPIGANDLLIALRSQPVRS